jgi:drug/metabolite transporter (DMT)-like permease
MILFWSFSFIAVDISVAFIPPLSLALYRFIVASLCFLLIDLVKFVRSKLSDDRISNQYNSKLEIKKNFFKSNWLKLLITSFSGISLFFYAQYTSILIIGPSLPALFVCLLAPVLITLFALILFNEKLTLPKVIGFIIATIGGFFLVTGGDLSILHLNNPNFWGYFFALLTPLLWSIYSTFSKKIALQNSPFSLIKYTSYFGTIELLGFVFFKGDLLNFISNLFNPFLIISASYLGVICYVIGYYIWNTAQKKIDSAKVSSFLYLEPFFTLLFSFLLQREEVIGLINILGAFVVLIAVLIINYK